MKDKDQKEVINSKKLFNFNSRMNDGLMNLSGENKSYDGVFTCKKIKIETSEFKPSEESMRTKQSGNSPGFIEQEELL